MLELGWFKSLSSRFLACRSARLLVLAGTDRLDKELMIGQMQGKFQMEVVPNVGHMLHEVCAGYFYHIRYIITKFSSVTNDRMIHPESRRYWSSFGEGMNVWWLESKRSASCSPYTLDNGIDGKLNPQRVSALRLFFNLFREFDHNCGACP